MISLIFLFVAGIFKAIIDTLQFHFETSIFKNFNQKWWNPSISWKNKWKNGDPKQGERFLGSSTIFVSLTDAWHFFQHLLIFCLILSIVTYSKLSCLRIIDFLIFYTVFTVTFEIFFSKVFRKNIKKCSSN